MQSVSDLEKGVVDCETAVRGFVITGRDDFLDPLVAARAQIPDEERTIRTEVADSDVRALLAPLFADIDAYLRQWVDPVVTARRTLADAGRAARRDRRGQAPDRRHPRAVRRDPVGTAVRRPEQPGRRARAASAAR